MDKTGIANLALRKIGAQRIASFGDGTVAANVISDVYDAIRDEVLEVNPWAFAITTVALNQLSVVPLTGIANLNIAYALPNDFIRGFAINAGSGKWKFETYGGIRCIVTNQAGAQLKYLFRNEDPTTYSPSFCTALATRLAAEICFNLTQATKKAQALYEEYEQIRLPDAKANDASQGSPDEILASDWELARMSGGILAIPGYSTWIPIW